MPSAEMRMRTAPSPSQEIAADSNGCDSTTLRGALPQCASQAMAAARKRASIGGNILPRMIPDPPQISYWEASPHFQRLCRRKLGDEAWQRAEPQLAAMGQRAALEVAPLAAVA